MNRYLFVTVLSLGIFCAAATAGAQVWDLWDDVAGSVNAANMADNPNDAWSWLRSAQNDMSDANFFPLDTYVDDCGQTERDCWIDAGGDPSVSLSKSDADYFTSFGTVNLVPGGSVFFHPYHNDKDSPDDKYEYGVIRWTSPICGTVDIVYSFDNIDDDCGNGVDWWIRKGDTQLASGSLDNGASTASLNLSGVAVTIGDHINFVLGPHDDPLVANVTEKPYGCDSTVLDATISGTACTPTPTPTPTPQAEVQLNASSYKAGDSFTADFQLNGSIAQPFTAFAVLILPGGAMRNLMTLDTPLKPVASNVPKLDAPYTKRLLSSPIPAGAPLGGYEAVVVFFDPSKPITGRGDAFLDVNKTFDIE